MTGIPKTAALAAIAAFGTATMGGWAVTTVENPPAALSSGGSYRIEFTVRQHGSHLLTGLRPQVRVLDAAGGAGAEGAAFSASATEQEGRYAATIRVPVLDSVRLVVATGFGASRASELTLMPVPVVRPGATPPRLSPAEMGRRLFVAKGCGTCHLNGDVPEWAAWNQGGNVGPELTGRRLEAGYVRQRLTNPGSLPAIGSSNVRMPNLGLSVPEADALVALIAGSKPAVGN